MNATIITTECRQRLEALGKARNAAKSPEWSRRKSDVFSDAEVDVLGLYGEYAAGHYLGVEIDSTINSYGDSGVDLVYGTLSVAVKFNHRWRGYLMVEQRPGDAPSVGIVGDLTSDLIILTHGKCFPPERCYCRREGGLVVALAGWLWREEFVSAMYARDLGLGVRYICTCEQLRPMHEIWTAEQSRPRDFGF